MEKQYLTTDEYAKQLGLASLTIRRWIKDGKLKAVKIGNGRKWHIPVSELSKYDEE